MKNEVIDLADFHSHILPGLDHGSSSLATSISQLNIAKKFNVSRIIATSHFYPHVHTLENFIKMRKIAAQELINNLNICDPEIKIGAEVLLCDGLDRLSGLNQLCFSGTDYLLLELPFNDFKLEYCDTIHDILKSGIDVILAHADRYPRENIEYLFDVGVSKIQLNAASLSSFLCNKHLIEWIDKGYVVAIGSDIHGSHKKAYQHFSKAKRKLASRIEAIKEKSDKIWNEIESEF